VAGAANENEAMQPLREKQPAIELPVLDRQQEKAKKKLVKRRPADVSQKYRSGVQVAFLLLNLWIGLQFYLFVRHYGTWGQSPAVPRPPGVEGWLPIASLMNLKAFLLTAEVPRLHPAGLFILISFLAISLVFRKSFCSWFCPIGTISETLWKFGRRVFGRNYRLPLWLDILLRGCKFLVLGLFVYAIVNMPVIAIRQFLEGPYGVVADVKMMNFFRYMSTTAAVVITILVVASIFVQNFWCRYLCPYGALLGFFSLLSPAKIRRNPDLCIDCAKCAKACPSRLPVNRKSAIHSMECVACYECVSACPAQGALGMTFAGDSPLSPRALSFGIVVIFAGLVLVAMVTGNWYAQIPPEVYQDLIPRAHEFSHP
jgi:polyferredoxin